MTKVLIVEHFMLKLDKIEDIALCAKQFVEMVGVARVFAFYGDMGAGKTTFIKAVCRELGVQEDVTSPTFAIVNEYESNTLDQPIYHFDFYRINSEEEAYDMGCEEYFYSGSYCFIEWPEKISNLLPDQITNVYVKVLDDTTRTIEIQ